MQRKEFDRLAEEWKNSEKTRRFSYKLLKRFVGEKDLKTVIDIGCGKGVVLPVLRKLFGEVEILCMDFSMEMLKGLDGGCCLKVQARAEEMPLKNGCSDMVIAVNSFPHFTEKINFLRSAYYVLRGGGLLIILHSMNRKRINRFHRSLDGAIRNANMPHKRSLIGMMKDAGFERVSWHERKGLIVIGKKEESYE